MFPAKLRPPNALKNVSRLIGCKGKLGQCPLPSRYLSITTDMPGGGMSELLLPFLIEFSLFWLALSVGDKVAKAAAHANAEDSSSKVTKACLRPGLSLVSPYSALDERCTQAIGP